MDKPDLSLFPALPGVYLYKDAGGRIVYVGKARRLRQRIASYFTDRVSPKTRSMLSVAASIDILRTGTEKEALLLEASLIKKHRPRYNILLRDDKEYLLFRISNTHPYPRVEVARQSRRRPSEKNARIFGPFSSGTAARETWKLLHKHFPLRRCRDVAFANRTRPCLYHDMGQCLAPCVLPVPESEYQALLHKVSLLLSGRSRDLLDKLKDEMALASSQLRFEQAAVLRDQIRALERTLEHQSVVLPRSVALDILGVAQAPEGLALGILFVREGLLLDGRGFFWPGLSVDDTPELIAGFLAQFYLERRGLGDSIPPRVIIPWVPWLPDEDADDNAPEDVLHTLEAALAEIRGAPVHITRPRDQDEDKLSLMAAANAREAIKTADAEPMADLLAKAFASTRPIRRIEVVDISHTSGRETRAGMVVFEDEEPLPNAYRAYALDEDIAAREAEAGDDYAALAAFATRRAASGPPWPDLLLVDGGKGQLAAVARAFSPAFPPAGPPSGRPFPFLLASIAKARLEDGRSDRRAGNVRDRIFLPGRGNPLNLQPGSREILFLQRVRDAAHDYVIGRHRRARAAKALTGELTRLPGIGPEMARRLFDHFGSLAAMAQAGEEALTRVPGIGPAKAKNIASRLAALIDSVGFSKNAV